MNPSPIPLPTIPTTPMSQIDIGGLINGVAGSLKGGMVSEIIAAVLLILVLIAYFLVQSKINAQAAADATAATQNTNTAVQQNANVNSGIQEGNMASDQGTLLSVEQQKLKDFLDALADDKLIGAATTAYGTIPVADALGSPVVLPLADMQRAAIYKLYGLG